MTEQPTALRLADELEMWTLGEPAAAELRRLHAQRDALLEALKQIEPILARMYGPQAAELPPMQIVRAAIETGGSPSSQRPAEPQEPDSPERRCGGPGCDGTCCQPVQEPQGCDHCNHPLYAAIKCRVCGRAHKIGGEE